MAARSYLQRIATPLAGAPLMLRPTGAPATSPFEPAPLRTASSPIRAEAPRRPSEPLSPMVVSAADPAPSAPDLADWAAAEPAETPEPHRPPAAAAHDHAPLLPERTAPAPLFDLAAPIPPASHNTERQPNASPSAVPRAAADRTSSRRPAPLAELAPIARAEPPPREAPAGPAAFARTDSDAPAFARRAPPREPPQVRIGTVEVRTSPIATAPPMIAPAPRAGPQAPSRLSSGLGWRYSLHQG